jgi:hypothetical protein
MQAIKEITVSLTTLLMEIRQADQTPAMAKFTFDMHLDKYKSDELDLPYLVAAKEIIQDWLKP